MSPSRINKPLYSSDMEDSPSSQFNSISSVKTKSTRSVTRPNNVTTLSKTKDNVTKESLLWFQSLKKEWFNTPRTPVQPILPIPANIELLTTTSSSQQVITTTTTTSSKRIDNVRTSITMLPVVEKLKQQKGDIDSNTSTHRFENVETVHNGGGNNVNNTATTTDHYRERLIQFYTQYNPTKLNTIEQTLQQYFHREEELFQQLHERYCKYLPIPQNVNHDRPIVFLEFEYNTITKNQQENIISQRATVQIQLFHDVTPYTAENFRCLCTGEKDSIDCNTNSCIQLCYINSFIHRIVPNMCIQGGDITVGDGTGGRSIYPPPSSSQNCPPKTDLWGNFIDEAFMAHSESGLLSMANNGPNRNNSQFFITVRGPLPHLNGKHVVFGKVIHGMNTIHDITNSAVTDPTTQRPIQNVKIVDCGQVKRSTDENNTELWIRASEPRNDGSDNSRIHKNRSAASAYQGNAGTNGLDNSSLSNGTSSHTFGNGNAFSFTSSVSSVSNIIQNNGCDCTNVTMTIKSDDMTLRPTDNTSSQLEKSNLIHEAAATETNAGIDLLPLTNVSPTHNETNRSTSDVPIFPTNSIASTVISGACLATNDDVDAVTPSRACFTEVHVAQEIPNRSYDACVASCHTKPTCRDVFEKLIANETLPATNSIIDYLSERKGKMREDRRPTDITSDITAPSTPFSQHSSNDESTTEPIDTSYCCDTSNYSVETSVSSTSEQVEWLHRLIDDAQHKLRVTRKKFEDRINVLKCRPVILKYDTTVVNSTLEHDRNVPSCSDLHPTSHVASEVNLNINLRSPSVHADDFLCLKNDVVVKEKTHIDCQFIHLLLNGENREKRNPDAIIPLTLPNIPPDIGIALLMSDQK